MKDSNLRATIATRAAQIAVGELKSIAWHRGTRWAPERISDLPAAIASHIAANPSIVEKATTDVALWRCAKITSGAQKSRR